MVLVLFSDFQCPYCKEEAKMLRANLLSAYPKQVRLYFKDLPLEQIHPWAKPAAIAGRCVFKQNPTAFWDFHDWIFEQPGEITKDNFSEKVWSSPKARRSTRCNSAAAWTQRRPRRKWIKSLTKPAT